MKKSLLAFDLDDTVIGSDGCVSPANFSALEKLYKAGVICVASTGRTYYEIPKSVRESPFVSYIIFSDGAVCVSTTGEIVFKNSMTNQSVKELLKLLCSFDTMPELYYNGIVHTEKAKLNSQSYFYYGIEKVYHSVMDATRMPVSSLEKVLDEGEKTEIVNVFFHSYAEKEECYKQLSALNNFFDVTTSMQNNLEILQKNINKGTSLERLCNILCVEQKNIFAMGDSKNDIDMIEFAPNSMAVANACYEIKQKAKHVICSCDENALEYVYENFFQKER